MPRVRARGDPHSPEGEPDPGREENDVESKITLTTLGVGDLAPAVAFCRDGLRFRLSSFRTADVAWASSLPLGPDGRMELPD
jgi:hypothetical protein